jgi:formate C-acetyltransferase
LTQHAPQTVHEALQLFWFTFLLGAKGTVGRFDQWMYPCYRADIDSGRLTQEQAQELLDCLWIKMNYFAGNNDSLRNVALAGQTRDGRDAANDLTFMCLQASAKLMLPEPKLNVRFFNGSPRALLEDCCKLIKKGLSQPAIFNDEVILPGLLGLGIPIEDARDYCNDGCSEIIMGGRGTISFRVYDLLPILNATVHSAPQEGFPTFDALLGDFKHRVAKCLPSGQGTQTSVTHAYLGPSMEDCLEKASPAGVRYCMWGEIAAGVANTADGLAAIKKLVFEEKVLSWQALVAAMKADYKGEHEVTRQMLLNRAPKFGNDEDEVDLIAKDITEFFLDTVHAKGQNCPGFGPKRAAGLMSFGIHNRKNIASSPDGRRVGEHCGNSFSPGLGRDRKGPTAVFKTVSKVDMRKASHGSVLDIAFHPTAVQGEEGFQKLVALLDTFLKLPCTTTLQTNVIDRDTLLAARASPKAEQYRTLIVRVWGFSAVFVELIPDLQDHVIARTEHRF